MQDYLTAIIKPLLTEPTSFKVSETNDLMGVLFTVGLHSKDMGPVIGKDGEGAKSIRHLMRVYGFMNGARVSIKFNEPEGGRFYTSKTTTIHG